MTRNLRGDPRMDTSDISHGIETFCTMRHRTLEHTELPCSMMYDTNRIGEKQMSRKRLARVEKKCKACKKKFTQNKSWQVFCSDSCRVDWHCERVLKGKQLLEDAEKKEAEES